ncbi:hypothetical protein R3W88_006292 [Solanum pinnatisectum]|uniref:Uncharacterized protein n=1 Tax=Solanum pinnatisectum TaxID=50273 RepID=A0AAV9KEU6_9SOLN|nr:hypothetical protein R3W88_006292 [Solanum pinnatisectum]
MTRSFDEKKSVQTRKEESFVIKQSKKRKRHHHAIRIHLADEITTNILSNHDSEKLLVGQWCMDTPNIFNFYSSRLSSVQLVEDDVEKLVCPSNYKPAIRYRVYSSCNGLVLLSIRINTSSTLRKTVHFLLYGLGYDTISNDHKILKFTPNMEILPLKSGLWRKTNYCGRDLLPILCNALMDPLAFLHGAFHWDIDLGHPKDHFDYGLNSIPFYKELLTQKA